MNLAQVTRIWLSGRSPATTKLYDSFIGSLEQLSQEHFSKSILDVSPVQLEELLRIKHSKAQAVTKCAQIFYLKGFFKTAKRLGAIKKDPSLEIRAPKFQDKLADRLLTHAQVLQLIEAATEERDKILLHVLYGAGLRISEALALKTNDLLDGGVIRVWGKGEKTAYVNIKPGLETLLRRWADTLPPGGYLFTGYHGKPIHRSTAGFAIKRIAKKAGLPKVSAHFFRHAHASVALSRGASIAVVQKSLRHSNINTTTRYLHVLPGESASNYLPEIDCQGPESPRT